MRTLFVHQNFPAQYRHLVRHMASLPDCETACIGESSNLMRWPGIDRVRMHGYSMLESKDDRLHPYLAGFDSHVRRGQRAARAALELKKSGFKPDVICVHTGWGEGLYVKDVFPDARVLAFCEFYYNADASDTGFAQKGDISLDKRLLTRTRNATQLVSMAASDWGISPMEWQRAQYPSMLTERISVIHDGIDTGIVQPNAEAHCALRTTGVKLTTGDEVVTFVSRNLEPYRGFHILVEALPHIQKLRPNAHVVIVGENGVSYGAQPPKGTTFRKMFMSKVQDKLDLSKVHFLGRVPYNHFVTLLQVSSAHVYLTYPFVLSWSMLEAMSAGCLIIGSKTPPVEEVLRHEENGLLVDFFSAEEIAVSIDRVLSHPTRMRHLRDAARETIVENYDLQTVCLPKHMNLLQTLSNGKTPN